MARFSRRQFLFESGGIVGATTLLSKTQPTPAAGLQSSLAKTVNKDLQTQPALRFTTQMSEPPSGWA
jgi:hypothetical protein